MSYILDALRKSESERRQGRVPDLGQQMQLVHKPRKKSSGLAVWIGAGLALNAVVLAVVFWPAQPEPMPAPEPSEQQAPAMVTEQPEAAVEAEPPAPVPAPEIPVPTAEPIAQQRPTIIVPSQSSQENARQPMYSAMPEIAPGSVPHLVELPLAFQKSVPDLVFNSHIYASEPSSRRVMINNQYLKAGDVFAGIRVEQITEEGVVLSRNGRSFRVGIVTDWVSPE